MPGVKFTSTVTHKYLSLNNMIKKMILHAILTQVHVLRTCTTSDLNKQGEAMDHFMPFSRQSARLAWRCGHTCSKACVSRLVSKPERGSWRQQAQSGSQPPVCVTETDHSADYLRYVTGCLCSDVQVCNGRGDFTCLRPAGSIFISCCIFITQLTVFIGAKCGRGVM